MNQAQELEPLSLIMSTDRGQILYLARRYDQAIVQLRKTLEMDRNFFRAHLWLARAYEQSEMYKEAIEEFQMARQPRSPIPWLHIVEVVAEAAKNEGYAKMGILGTRFLMEGKVYPKVLSNRNIEAVFPKPEQREQINSLILDELVKGTLKDSTRDYFRRSVAELAAAGCDAVVMACTEIPLVLRPEDVAIPLLDSTRLLAKAALKEALS